jgi:alpha-beta hydrolase superfamily lysophospholipase
MKRLLANFLGLALLTGACAPALLGDTGGAQAKTTVKRSASAKTPKTPKNVNLNPTDIPTMKWDKLVNAAGRTVPARAVVLFIHGLGLHKATYDKLAKELNHRGVICYAIDVRGFGDWIKRDENNRVNYAQTFQDIRVTLQYIKNKYPTLPLYISGESMGGALALQATARNQDLLDGMFTSVPAGDRVHGTRMALKIAVHALSSGFNKLMPIGKDVVDYGTDDPAFTEEWSTDPMGRMTMTPSELIAFDHMCDDNFKAAKQINKVPCLIVQGGYDGLIVPAATAQLADSFPPENTDRVIAYSKNSEHLIFEYGRYKPEDLKYVTDWLDKKIGAWNKSAGSVADATVKVPGPGATLSYWIELLRDGKYYRCNNKMSFKTGDEIRFHMTPNIDGYVYVVMEQSSRGNRMVLFPDQVTGTQNQLKAGKDCIVPTNSWLKFDEQPGVEQLGIFFSRTAIDNTQIYMPKEQVAYISPSMDGSKDIVPARMKLKWDDTEVVAMAPDAVASSLTDAQRNSGIVSVSSEAGMSVMALKIALEHK